MSPPKKSLLGKREDQKKACRHCKHVFNNGKALGGHMKVHYKDRRKTNFTRRKKASQRNTGNIITHQVADISNSLSDFHWKTKERRSVNCENEAIIFSNYYDANDEYEYDADDEYEYDEEEGLTMMERLSLYGFVNNRHEISKRERLYVCNTCNLYFSHFHAVFDHLKDNHNSVGSIGSNEDDVHDANSESSKDVDIDREEKVDVRNKGEYEELEANDEERGEEEEMDEEEEKDCEMSFKEKNEWEMSVVKDGDGNSFEAHNIVKDEKGLIEDSNEEQKEGVAGVENVQVIKRGEEDKVLIGEKASTQVDEEETTTRNCGSVDQVVPISNPSKILNFDLNELPPKED